MMTLGERVYRALLRLYPTAHHRAYGDLMTQTFRDGQRDARNQGRMALVGWWWRALTDAAMTIVIEHLEARKKYDMRNLFAKTNEPGTWPEAFAGAVSFIVYGTLGILFAVNVANGIMPRLGPLGWSWGVWIVLIGNIATAVVLAVGWIKGFPRWSYAALLPLWFYSDYLTTLHIGGQPAPLTGIRAWLPVLIALGYALLRTRSLRSLWVFVTGIWQDWSRLSFLLYGFLAVVIPLSGDETHSAARVPLTIVAVVFMTIGAVAYVRAESPGQRILALFGGMMAGSISIFLFVMPYWNGRYESWMQNPQPTLDTFSLVMQAANVLIGFALILFSPVLIAGIRRVVTRHDLPN
ncbi:MAG: hypothetical protein H6672_00695 [Anaerolineaceae bacterium]|nr:hypothetical protein [Anaerolineaceae bacterium]